MEQGMFEWISITLIVCVCVFACVFVCLFLTSKGCILVVIFPLYLFKVPVDAPYTGLRMVNRIINDEDQWSLYC